MLKIRLQRQGKRGYASFAVIVTEHTRGPTGPALERLGWWNPHQNRCVVNRERLKHWLERGAQLSPTVHNLMVEQKLVQAEKVRVWKPKRKEKKSREKGKKEKKEEKVSGKADEKSGEAEKGAAA